MFACVIRGIGIGTLLCLGSCGSSGPPWTVSQSPEQITLRWYPDATPDVAANWVAQTHCGSWGKDAELVSYDQDGSAQLAHFRCR